VNKMKTITPEIEIKSDSGQLFYKIEGSEWLDRRELARRLKLTYHNLSEVLRGMPEERQKEWICDKVWLLNNGHNKICSIYKRDGVWLTALMISKEAGIHIHCAHVRGRRWINGEKTLEETLKPKSEEQIRREQTASVRSKQVRKILPKTKRMRPCDIPIGSWERDNKHLFSDKFSGGREVDKGPISLPF